MCSPPAINTALTAAGLAARLQAAQSDASGDTTDGDADDYVAQFTTPGVAPTVTSTPVAGATVPNTQTVTLNFSEQVNVPPAPLPSTAEPQ